MRCRAPARWTALGVILRAAHDPMWSSTSATGSPSLPQGVRGGLPSQAGYQAKVGADGSLEVYETDAYCHLEAGSKLHAIDNGGGGYGDPLEREPERVLHDVNECYVSRAKAEALYGVVIVGSEEDDDLAVDAAATEGPRTRLGGGQERRRRVRQRAPMGPQEDTIAAFSGVEGEPRE